jgi:polyhydroxyalkanoate synthesis repressor PhaR
VFVAGTPEQAQLIKRYENRKLYDAAARRYVTLEELAARVARGEELLVHDQKTGEDLTNLVLAQVLLEGVKEQATRIPRQVLTRLVRLSAAKPTPQPPPQPIAARARDEAERIVSGLLSRGRLTLEEALALRQEIAGSVLKTVAHAQSGLEHALHGLLERTEREAGGTPALRALKEKLMTLETYLEIPGDKGRPRGKTARRSGAKRRK